MELVILSAKAVLALLHLQVMTAFVWITGSWVS